ncbi:MAG: hypothetical protein ACHP84_19700 [Caulobacterales bacterium]
MRRNSGDQDLARAATLGALPGLLTIARRVILASFEPGDPEVDGLRELLERCVVDAHRICLRERIRMNEDFQSG